MMTIKHSEMSGDRVPAGPLAGRALLAASGLFSRLRRGRTHAATHDAAPATFHCPRWPACACPDGTVDRDCPGLTRNDLRRGTLGRDWILDELKKAERS